MKGWLRSWKLCEIRRENLGGDPGWRKYRMARTAWLAPPGNLFMRALGASCQMLGRNWAQHETSVFHQSHPDFPEPRVLDHRTIWLPDLPGETVSGLRGAELSAAASLAFAELGRFHRLAPRSFHGDPHAGNFLYDRQARRCRIIDFETDAPASAEPAQARAQDFMILALHLGRLDGSALSEFPAWREAYGGSEDDCPVAAMLRAPDIGLRTYWHLLGYKARGVTDLL